MSNLLTFITSFGTIAELQSLPKEALIAKMREYNLTEEEISTIIEGDRERIVDLVSSSENIVCGLIVPEKPDDDEGEGESEDDDSGEQNQALKQVV